MLLTRFFAAAALLPVLAACTPEPELLPACSQGQYVQRTAAGLVCASEIDPTGNALSRAELNCEPGQLPVAQANGGWSCGAVTSTSGGDVTAVRTPSGSGLSGGTENGEATLEVAFAGTGAAATVARSDHNHSFLSLDGVPVGFLDQVDNDALGALACSNEQVPRFDSLRGAWACWTPPSTQTFTETDPTVNSLGRAAAVNGCTDGQVPVRVGTGWGCSTPQDQDSLAALSCAAGEVLGWFSPSNSWGCRTVPVAPTGMVTEVAAGSGLVSDRDGGTVALAVDFQSACASGKVACSDDLVTPPTPTLGQVMAQGDDAQFRRIRNLAAPIASTDAVTRGYVDALGSGGGSALSLVICCGAGCGGRLPGWNCDDVVGSGQVVLPLPDRRGMLAVPNSGRPRILAAVPPTALADGGVEAGDVYLEDCAAEWQVCTQTGFTAAMMTCGGFTSTQDPAPWNCTAPAQSYVFVPTMKGVLYVDGTDSANEYLDDQGQSAVPPAVIDCSGAPVLPGPGVRTGVCFR